MSGHEHPVEQDVDFWAPVFQALAADATDEAVTPALKAGPSMPLWQPRSSRPDLVDALVGVSAGERLSRPGRSPSIAPAGTRSGRR